MNWNLSRKRDVLSQIWETLALACRQHDHPLRTPVLGTGIRASSKSPFTCQLRTVVLREVLKPQRSLVFHTDLRSSKCRDMQANSMVQSLSYDPVDKIQIKALAQAHIHHHNERARLAWLQTPLPSRVNYGTPRPPGTPIAHPARAWDKKNSPQNLTVPGSEKGWDHFALVITKISNLEFLHLSPEGHRRLRFAWPHNRLTASWLVP